MEIIEKIKDWEFEERLNREFEAIGFFISDHPLNQFKDVFCDYNIVNFNDFNNEKNNNESNIAGTLLKIQEKKTQKGNSYAIIKLTDLTSVFELFIFSDLLELNREILKEGNSLILTITKNITQESNRFKRINVRKIASLKNLFNKPISNIELFIKDQKSIDKIERILSKDGSTEVKIKIQDEKNKYIFNLKNKRFVDRKSLNLLKNQGISTNIL
jgi:DNA polymerase-3 subunit alpha